jgi:hypothetical protein
MFLEWQDLTALSSYTKVHEVRQGENSTTWIPKENDGNVGFFALATPYAYAGSRGLYTSCINCQQNEASRR